MRHTGAQPHRRRRRERAVRGGTPRAEHEGMRLHTSLVASAFAAAAASLISNVARADCAAPRSYTTHVDGDSVTICPTNPDSKNAAGCPVAGGMLRRDTATGAVVKLADQCTGADPGCYVDECVPTGIYQYGYGE